MGTACGNGERRNIYRVLLTLLQCLSIQEDNIKINLNDIGYEGVDWIHRAVRMTDLMINTSTLLSS